MKNHGLVLVPVFAALLSTTAIVAAAQKAPEARAVSMKELKTFDTRFNAMINKVIRKPRETWSSAEPAGADNSAEVTARAYIAETCYRDWVAYEAEVFKKVDAKKVCKFSLEESQTLRDEVNRWLDRIYLRQIPGKEIKQLKRSADFFSEKLPSPNAQSGK